MWTRYELKSAAVSVLKNSYWKSVLVVLIVSFIGTSGSTISNNLNVNMNNTEGLETINRLSDAIMNNLNLVMVIMLSSLAMGLLVSVFLSAPLNVGMYRFFNEAARGNVRIEEVLFPASKGFKTYLNIVKVLFIKTIFLILWGLIFIISFCAVAGYRAAMIMLEKEVNINIVFVLYLISIASMIPFIVKSYQYMMVDYILTDFPNMTWKEAMSASKRMTKGEIWNMIVLQLSFLGWILLGMMAFGIGVIFVTPYMNATYTQLYFKLKQKLENNASFDVYENPTHDEIVRGDEDYE